MTDSPSDFCLFVYLCISSCICLPCYMIAWLYHFCFALFRCICGCLSCICLPCYMIHMFCDKIRSLSHFCFLWAKLMWARRGKKLPAPKLIGRTAHNSFKGLRDLVMDGQSRTIGVQGMTGVGKTAIMMNVYNQILDTEQNQFNKVIWLDSDLIQFIQDEKIKLFENKKRILFFMDGVEDYTEMLHFTKPNRENGCKLVFTTRSVDVCTRMGCKEDCIVQVELLSEMEALVLFWDMVKVKGNPTPRMTNIAEEVVRECDRLPLMIVVVGKEFRRKNEFEWDKLLSIMRNSDRGIMEIAWHGIYKHMKYTWDRILELCALYPKDWKIPTKEFIKYTVALDVHQGEQKLMSLKSYEVLKSVEVDFESNHEWGEGVQIQPLYRDYSLGGSALISKCGLMLKKLPEEIKWREDLKGASFICNNIKTISISPKCPRLSILFLNKNLDLCTISHHFFVHITGLRILDLRDNLKMETLPDSISDLIDLRILRLSRCRSLKQVPSLAKLLHMQMLELDETAIEELPHGIEMLVELTVLKLHSLSLREAIPSDYISLLNSLPHLELHL